MNALDRHLKARAEAEARLEIERAGLRAAGVAVREHKRRITPPVVVLGGLLLGWLLGRRAGAPHAAAARAPRAHGESAHAAAPPPRPTAFGLASLLLAGSRAVPAVLPVALAWFDRRRAARTPDGIGPTPVPLWLLALRAAAPLLLRRR